MATNIKLKEAFEADLLYGAFYTGGVVQWTNNGNEFLCQVNAKINVVDIESCKIIKEICVENKDETFNLEEDSIYTFALNQNEDLILTANKSGLLKLWSKQTGELLKQWKSQHSGPVARVSFRSRSTIVASGDSNASIRIWDHDKKMCLAVLRGSGGVYSILEFYPDSEQTIILGCADDNTIYCYDYSTKELIASLKGHYSKVTAISFTEDYTKFVSVSRDKVLILWDFINKTQIRTIPLYEGLEGVVILPNIGQLPNGFSLEDDNSSKIYVAVAGTSGCINFWECTESKIVYSQTNSVISKSINEDGLAILQLMHCQIKNQLAVVSADHNIFIHNINSFHISKQLVGFSDEILDICFAGNKNRYLAVATNSNDIKLYDTSNMNCQLLKGHTDIVLSVSSHKNLLLSSGKDNAIRIWEINPGNFTVRCVAKGVTHTGSVGASTFGKISTSVCASGSQDTCLKTWSVPKIFEDEDIIDLTCTNTTIAHEKEINCVTTSPNDRIIATSSQDKTAKLWSAENLQLIGTLKGHSRGVWSCRFSPVDQVLLTTSADCTMRLWSISDMSCLKSFQGHDSSILDGEFISKGMQLISAGGDGLIKIWNIKNNECCTTLDKHESRVWTLAVAEDETYFYSAGSDSQLIRWKDVTEEKKTKEFNEMQEITLQEQELANLIGQNKMLKALRFALRLDKPNLTLKIINSLIENREEGLEESISTLNELHKENLMKHAVTWNTNSRNTRPAQLVLNILIKEILANKFKPSGLGKIVEESLPYTERHFKRMTEYLKDLKFIEFTLNCMQPFNNKMDISTDTDTNDDDSD